jgi:hypothetical protein
MPSDSTLYWFPYLTSISIRYYEKVVVVLTAAVGGGGGDGGSSSIYLLDHQFFIAFVIIKWIYKIIILMVNFNSCIKL